VYGCHTTQVQPKNPLSANFVKLLIVGSAVWIQRDCAIIEVNHIADDIIDHEITHGVTDYESDLIYLNESDAINESFSDMWGEWIDQLNGRDNDSNEVKCLIGEDMNEVLLDVLYDSRKAIAISTCQGRNFSVCIHFPVMCISRRFSRSEVIPT